MQKKSVKQVSHNDYILNLYTKILHSEKLFLVNISSTMYNYPKRVIIDEERMGDSDFN